MSKAIAFLAGMGSGYLNAKQREEASARQAKLDQIVFDRADAERQDRDRVQSERNRVADAYAPVTMQAVMTKPDTADNRDVGTPGTELVDTGTKRVGQQTFGPDQTDEAQAAVAAANKPEAQTARASSAMLSMGNVAGAQALRTGARQERLAGLQLDKAEQEHLNTMFDASLQPLASHDAIAQTVSGSNIGGALQLRAVPSADGKTVEYQTVAADGSTKPTGYSFSNDAKGLLEAKAAMSKMTPVTQKLEYLHKQAQVARETERDAAAAADRRATREQQQPLIDSQVRENNARAGYYQSGGAQAGKAPAVERMAEPDKVALDSLKDERGRAEKRIAQIEDAILKLQSDPMITFDEASPNAMGLRQQLRQQQERVGALRIQESAILRKYQSAAPSDPYGLRGGGAPVATTRPATPMEAVRQDMAASGVQTADIDVQGVRTRVGPPVAAAPAGAAPRPVASMADMIPGSGGVKAPPAAGAAPAAAAPAAPAQQPFQQFLAANITTPQGKAAILRRVRTELPQIQQAILADAQVLRNPNVSPDVKATLNARIAANQATAEMMQRFVDGNPGLTP